MGVEAKWLSFHIAPTPPFASSCVRPARSPQQPPVRSLAVRAYVVLAPSEQLRVCTPRAGQRIAEKTAQGSEGDGGAVAGAGRDAAGQEGRNPDSQAESGGPVLDRPAQVEGGRARRVVLQMKARLLSVEVAEPVSDQ